MCQELAGMRVTEEFICMDAPEFLLGHNPSLKMQWEVVDKTYQIEGFTPTLSMSSEHCDVKINLCYYESSKLIMPLQIRRFTDIVIPYFFF